MSCNNCHPNGGQREKAMPLVGIDKIFPEYNKRAGRIFTLEERIIGCLLRSINATGSRTPGSVTRHENELNRSSLNAETQEVQDLASYITWLSPRPEVGNQIPWRGHNSLPPSALIPVKKLNPKLGKALYDEWCAYCHGKDGQGLDFFGRSPGPLWGPNSWNDGAGAVWTYTLAGMIRHWMPYLNPGLLSDEQAQHIAAYITSQPRPRFPFKEKDYLKEKIPSMLCTASNSTARIRSLGSRSTSRYPAQQYVHPCCCARLMARTPDGTIWIPGRIPDTQSFLHSSALMFICPATCML